MRSVTHEAIVSYSTAAEHHTENEREINRHSNSTTIVDANALLRAYIWHCIGIPLVASIFMAVHFWRIRKDGGISGPAPVMLESEMKVPKKK